jgi:hypothetical protein
MRTFITLLFAFVLLSGCASPTPAGTTEGAADAPATAAAELADLDLSTTQTSAQGLFTVSYKSESNPIAINQLHTWTLQVAGADGAPLEGAAVTVDGGMPAHNHGLPTAPIVTALGGGEYRVEGMKFQMPGQWTISVTVDAAGQRDTATFNLLLD